jgi:hypothetical protein
MPLLPLVWDILVAMLVVAIIAASVGFGIAWMVL